ncbi:flagellar basal body rod protein FlgC [Providencia sneebia]|uniref:Flagellar basal-body rod protein FlgC n=1 Tax=Providencia sneebia DSM 19967 TaxID=1141660 RepID=K8WM53_9GAMM|nr:flagellar basal body rod protein FlgC [Providencia sneebia]EKT58557.1 flagellar basal-body rod cell-proximal protein [Providencia sneebia DSM 19967]
MGLLSIFDIPSSALTAQSQRLNVSASNMANSQSVIGPDNTPFQAKQVIFRLAAHKHQQIGGVYVSQIVDDPSPPRLEYKPNHPLADEKGFVHMPNVDMVGEMVNTISASRSYQANLEVMNIAKILLQKTLMLGQ